MEFCNYKKKLGERETHKDKMLNKLKSLEKLINSELSSKVLKSLIEKNELLIEINENDLIDVIQFFKSNEK